MNMLMEEEMGHVVLEVKALKAKNHMNNGTFDTLDQTWFRCMEQIGTY